MRIFKIALWVYRARISKHFKVNNTGVMHINDLEVVNSKIWVLWTLKCLLIRALYTHNAILKILIKLSALADIS